MTVAIKRRTVVERATVAGSDEVFGWCPLPAGGVFKGANVSIAVIGEESSSIKGAMIYGLSGYIVPVLDPNTRDATPEITWNLQVPKDEAIAEASLDFDYQTTANVSPAVQVGAINQEEVFQAMAGATKLFKTERIVTFADTNRGWIAGTPDVYNPAERLSFRVKKQVRVKVPSVILFALSAPTPGVPGVFTGDVSGWIPGNAAAWLGLRYIGSAIEQSMPFVAGSVEAGAHEPYEQMAEGVARVLEQAFEDTTGAFLTQDIQHFSSCMFDIEVPGHMNVRNIRGG